MCEYFSVIKGIGQSVQASRIAVQPNDSAAIQAAKTAMVAKFVAHEMDANFVTHFQNDRNAITDAQKAAEGNRQGRVGDTASINPFVRDGVKATNTLDAIMHNKYASQPDKLAAWITANRLEHAAHRNNSQPQPAPQVKTS